MRAQAALDFASVADERPRLVPLTQREALAWIEEVHRHLPAPRGDVIRVGVMAGNKLVGVGIAGRPVSRMLDNGITLEITRVAVVPLDEGGPRNICSMIYGALRRAGQALGYTKFVTYTLPSEGGASLRASGWREAGAAGGGEWTRESRVRDAAAKPDIKTRWEYP
jgi:hypothetical protein